jgi:hypothetical protein
MYKYKEAEAAYILPRLFGRETSPDEPWWATADSRRIEPKSWRYGTNDSFDSLIIK